MDIFVTRDIDRLAELLRNGADPDARARYRQNPYGITLIMCTHRAMVMRLLVNFGADVNAFMCNNAEMATAIMRSRAWKKTYELLKLGGDPTMAIGSVRRIADRLHKMKAWIKRRKAVLVMLLSVVGLPKGVALSVGRWVLRTH